MRWSIVRVIWQREVRDQVRDRRTLFMVVVLPLLLYPMLGLGLVQFAQVFHGQPIQIGVAGAELLDSNPIEVPEDVDPRFFLKTLPSLLEKDRFATGLFPEKVKADRGLIKVVSKELPELLRMLEAGEVQAVLNFTPMWVRDVRQGRQVIMDIRLKGSEPYRQIVTPGTQTDALGATEDRLSVSCDDDRSRMAFGRLMPILSEWNRAIVIARMAATGAPPRFHRPLRVPVLEDKSERVWSRLFPFLIVMMALTGALYPAIDVCAGEKERGTMETLLISPASRSEIVTGKFLTVWLFSTATALLNLASLGVTAGALSAMLTPAETGLAPTEAVMPAPTLAALGWCVVLLIPLAALFSATCLALAIYARSTKEGQYFLMPMMLVTLILTFLSLAPGVELTPVYSMLPITGAALLLQALMNATTPEQLPWLYLFPVLLPLAAYCYLALYWAIQQFNREDVLFREAERLDLQLWMQRLLREKEPLPTAGEAMACFLGILLLGWFVSGYLSGVAVLGQIAFRQLVLIAAPALFMALLLISRPRASLRLVWPRPHYLLVGMLFALAFHVPLVWLLEAVVRQYPHITEQLRELSSLLDLDAPLGWQLLVIAFLPAVCEELAFRGFILSGLARRLGTEKAILASSLLFAFAHMNAFRFPATFILGLALGLLATRSGSLLPGMLFHFLHNGLLTTINYFAKEELADTERIDRWVDILYGSEVAAVSALVALGLAAWLWRRPSPPQLADDEAPSAE